MSFINLIKTIFTGTGGAPTDYTLGTDVSHWQGNINWAQMKEKGVKFVVTKATDFYSSKPEGWVDDKAEENYKGMKDNGVICGGYLWLKPQHDGKLQAQYYLDNFYKTHQLDFPPIVDFEDTAFTNANDYLWKLQTCLDTLEKATGKKPIVYTAKWFMDKFDKTKASFLSVYPLWTAHYIARTYPTIPTTWMDWKIWQYTSSGHYPYHNSEPLYDGHYWGVSSDGLDMNWFKGTYEQLISFCGETSGSVVPPQPSDEDEPLFQAKCNTNVLNVRSGAGTVYPIVGYLKLNDVRDVYEISGNWYRIDVNKWVSATYMTKIEPIESPQPPTTPSDPKVFYYPCDEGKFYITQYFGERPYVYTTSKGHNGIDFGTPVGSNIYATQDGIVVVSEDVLGKTGYGRHVRIKHADGISIYGHMTKRLVQVGQQVYARQLIGLSGGAADDPYSGYSTGAHLHFEYRLNNPADAPQVAGGFVYGAIDPMPLLASHSYTGENIAQPIFKAKCLISNLNTRYGAGIHFYPNGKIAYGKIVDVYAEKDGWFKISNKAEVWCSGASNYMQKIGGEPISDVLFQAKCIVGVLNVRSGAGTEYPIVRTIKNGDIVNVYEVASNGWYRIAKDVQEWCSGSITYMVKVQN